LRGKYIGLIGS